MTLDDRGRVWVAENHTYPIKAPEDEGKDRILIFEDARRRRPVRLPQGLLRRPEHGHRPGSRLRRRLGRRRPRAAVHPRQRTATTRPTASRDVLLDGWGLQDTHETLNCFTWGPDGWLYGCHGVFTHSRVGKPGTPDDERIPINAGVWRYHPHAARFEVFAHGTSNPWGVDFDEYGQCFIDACVIPHLYHIVQGGRYQRQAGPALQPLHL